MSEYVRTDVGRFAMVPEWVVDRLVGKPNAVVLYATLAAKWADRDTGIARPSVKAISEVTGWSEATVRRATSDLVEHGCIEVVRWWRVDGSQGPNRYVLRYARPDGIPEPDFTEEGDTPDEGVGASTPVEGGGSDLSTYTSINQNQDPESEGGVGGKNPTQQGFFDGEHRERITVFREFLAESFRGRRGSATNRTRLQRLVERGATMEQLKNAVAVTKQRTGLKDDLSFCIAVLARFVEEGVDGEADVRRATTGRSANAGDRAHAGAARSGRLAGQRQGPGAAVLDEYRGAF